MPLGAYGFAPSTLYQPPAARQAPVYNGAAGHAAMLKNLAAQRTYAGQASAPVAGAYEQARLGRIGAASANAAAPKGVASAPPPKPATPAATRGGGGGASGGGNTTYLKPEAAKRPAASRGNMSMAFGLPAAQPPTPPSPAMTARPTRPARPTPPTLMGNPAAATLSRLARGAY